MTEVRIPAGMCCATCGGSIKDGDEVMRLGFSGGYIIHHRLCHFMALREELNPHAGTARLVADGSGIITADEAAADTQRKMGHRP